MLYPFNEIPLVELDSVGQKAANLIRMAKNGINVPDGFVISDLLHSHFQTNNSIPKDIISKLTEIKSNFDGAIAVRSSSNCEDSINTSLAGVFISNFVWDDGDIGVALTKIYQQADSQEVSDAIKLHGIDSAVRMGVIVQKLIHPNHSGVLYTSANDDQFLIEYTDGFGNTLADGDSPGSKIITNNKGLILESVGYELRPMTPKAIKKLVGVAQKIERLFGNLPQDIEWAEADGEIFILQSRPLVTSLQNISLTESPEDTLRHTKLLLKKMVEQEKSELGTFTATFSDSNYSELLPRPTCMDIGIYQYFHGGRDGIEGSTQIARREMGYFPGNKSIGIIKYIGGRTYFSIARNAALYNIGIPTNETEYYQSLVNEYLSKIEADTTKAAYPQMGLYLQDPSVNDLRQRFGSNADAYFETYQAFTQNIQHHAETFMISFSKNILPEIKTYIKTQNKKDHIKLSNQELVDHIGNILEHIRTNTYVQFTKSARLGFYYSQQLREKFGDEIFSKLNQGLDGSAITDANLAISRATTEKSALRIAKNKLGHLSTGEMLEIRHEPLSDHPDKLKSYVQAIRSSGHYADDFAKQKKDRVETQRSLLKTVSKTELPQIKHIIESSQKYMALRETIKYYVSIELMILRKSLKQIEKNLELDSDALFHLYPRELVYFIDNPTQYTHLINARQREFNQYPKLDMPAVIREQDIDNLQLKSSRNRNFRQLSGNFLASGPSFNGIVVNIDQYPELSQVNEVINEFKQQEQSIVLVAKQINLSHDPLIALADGLIIENSGIVAHGAQRARELGKGAIGGIKSDLLKTGQKIFFDPSKQLVKNLSKK